MKIFLILFLLLSMINSLAQKNDTLVYKFGKNLTIYKNLNSNIFKIKKNDKKVIFENIKFTKPLGGYLQVLDKKNIPFYINRNGKKKKEVNISHILCGTVPHYIYEIIQKNGKYYLTENENFFDYEDKISPKIIDSIEIKGIDKINFLNKEKKIEFDGNSFIFNYTKVFPYAIIIQNGKQQGVLFENNLKYYDEVTYDSGLLKVKIDNQIDYYGITDVKYKELKSFIFGLAKFKTFDGRTGYVDSNGNEYYD